MLLQHERKLHDISVGHGCPPISHLMLTDDLMLFCIAKTNEVEVLKNCLDTYKHWSGQCMNKENLPSLDLVMP